MFDFLNKKPYSDREDAKRFQCSEEQPDSDISGWRDTIDRIDIAYSAKKGGIATFGHMYAGNLAVAGIKVFNLYNDPVNNPKLCEEEYEILCQLSDDGIVPKGYMRGTYDWADLDVRDSGNIYPAIVMELLPANESLSYEIEKGVFTSGEHKKLSAERVMEIALSIARSIATCHAKITPEHEDGIAHRDLSPNNIFVHLDSDSRIGVAKLIDFGSATYVNSNLNVTMGKGATPRYASPEMCLAKGDVSFVCPNGQTLYSQRKGKKTDIWSLGAIMYHLYKGEVPHNGLMDASNSQYTGSDYAKIKQEHPLDIGIDLSTTTPVDEHAAVLRQLILHCTKFYPEHRPGIKEVISVLERALSDVVTPPPPDARENQKRDDLEDRIKSFAAEMGLSVDETHYALKIGADATGCEFEFAANAYKWAQIARQVSAEISAEYGADEDALEKVIAHPLVIEDGDFQAAAADMRVDLIEIFEGLQILSESESAPEIERFTVSYKDGFGGKVFKDKVFSVPAGSPLLLPNMVGEIPDDFDMEDVGWSGPRADFVFENLEYEMTWRKKTCRIVYHDGVGGDIFSDVIHTVPFGSPTPPPPHLDPSKLEAVYKAGYTMSRWAKDDDRDQMVSPTVDGDAEYTLLWREM